MRGGSSYSLVVLWGLVVLWELVEPAVVALILAFLNGDKTPLVRVMDPDTGAHCLLRSAASHFAMCRIFFPRGFFGSKHFCLLSVVVTLERGERALLEKSRALCECT